LGILVWNFYQTFVTVSIEFWLSFEPQVRPTRLPINLLFVTAWAERKVRMCVKLFDFFRGYILIRLPWNLSRFFPNLVEILGWYFRTKLFPENFSEILCKRRLFSTETCEIPAQYLQFHSGSVLQWKKFTQALSYVVCTQARRHVHKRITKRRYGEEKSGRFVFRKPVLFTLGLGLTTPYSLGILVWNFYQTFDTVSIEFWMRLEPQVRPTRLGINLLFVNARAERKVRLCVKLFDFFRGWILIRLTKSLSRFVPNSVEIRGWNFRKNYSGRIFQKFCANQGYLLPKLVKFRSNFCNSIMGPYCAVKNSHKHFRMLFAPRQGGTSINESQKEDTGKKSQDVFFSETRFYSLSVWDLLRLSTWVFWSEIFTRHLSLCLLSFGWGLTLRFVPQDW